MFYEANLLCVADTDALQMSQMMSAFWCHCCMQNDSVNLRFAHAPAYWLSWGFPDMNSTDLQGSPVQVEDKANPTGGERAGYHYLGVIGVAPFEAGLLADLMSNLHSKHTVRTVKWEGTKIPDNLSLEKITDKMKRLKLPLLYFPFLAMWQEKFRMLRLLT